MDGAGQTNPGNSGIPGNPDNLGKALLMGWGEGVTVTSWKISNSSDFNENGYGH